MYVYICHSTPYYRITLLYNAGVTDVVLIRLFFLACNCVYRLGLYVSAFSLYHNYDITGEGKTF